VSNFDPHEIGSLVLHHTRPVTEDERFPGLSHVDVLGLRIPPTRQIVRDLIEAGTVGTIRGRAAPRIVEGSFRGSPFGSLRPGRRG
jgi:hypothetical protein